MKKIILEVFYKNRGGRFYKDYAPAIRAERAGLLVVEYEENQDSQLEGR